MGNPVKHAACTVALIAATGAFAQAYPTKPVRIVLAYASGGPTEFLARAVGEKASQRLGQPVLVEPRPGANERVATEYVSKLPPDGYTLLLIATPHSTNPSLFELPYDTPKTFTGVIHLSDIYPLITVHPDSPLRDVRDMVSAAKLKPDDLTYGSPGTATGNHLMMELLGLVTGTSMRHIPFKGDAPALTELLGNRLSVSTNALSSGLPYIKAGRLRALGTSGGERSPQMPDVPTLREQGFVDFVVTGWFGIVAHAQTPRPIINRLNAELDAALGAPEVREKIAAAGMIPAGGSAEKFTAHIRSENERWAKVIKARGIKVE